MKPSCGYIVVLILLLAAGLSPAANAQPEPQEPTTPAAPSPPQVIEVPAGTTLPLVMVHGISSRTAKVGYLVHFETLAPVVVGGQVVVPAGSFVQGTVAEVRRRRFAHCSGRIQIRLERLVLPNGYTVSLTASPTTASGKGGEQVDEEGEIKAGSSPPDPARPFVLGAGGAVVGAVAEGSPHGAALGGLAGWGAGIAYVLLAPGNELELPRGTSVDVVLQKPLLLDAGRARFSDVGRSSLVPVPPNWSGRALYRRWP